MQVISVRANRSFRVDKFPKTLRKTFGLEDGDTESSEGTVTNYNDG